MFFRIIVILATMIRKTVITGWIGVHCAIAAPIATLAKIAGKILPPRQPNSRMTNAITSKNNGEYESAVLENGTI